MSDRFINALETIDAMVVLKRGSEIYAELCDLQKGLSAAQCIFIAKLHKQQWVKLCVAEMTAECDQENMDESFSYP